MPPNGFDLPWDLFKRMSIELPPLVVQRAIAGYLDAETARIDALIAKKQRMVALIEEKLRLAIDASLGCSVAEGAAATHDNTWIPVRYLAKVRGGITLGKQYEGVTVSVPYLRVLNVQDGFLDLSDVAELQVPPEAVARYSLRTGDLLLLEGNGNPENLGRGTLWRDELPTCLHQNHVHVVRPDTTRVLPEYLDLVVRTSWARHYFTGGSDVVGISTLSQDRVRSLRIPCPPLRHQHQLVTQIERRRAVAHRTHETLQRQMQLLREHRHALITAAVTGEFEVPGVAA
jgi:type I restriction enzyme S subunit